MSRITIYDHRKQPIVVGDTVVYLPKLDIIADVHMVKVKTSGMEVSKVKDIQDLGGGFALAGNKVTVELEDGTILTGDSEWGGWGCLKLPA